MASAPNLRVASPLPIVGTGAAVPVEAGDFISRMLAAPLTVLTGGGGGESAQPSDGERETQDNPTVVTFEAAPANPDAPAQDLLAGLIPIVQAQGDYPIAVTFAPEAPVEAETETTVAEDGAESPPLPIVPTAPAPAAIVPTPTLPNVKATAPSPAVTPKPLPAARPIAARPLPTPVATEATAIPPAVAEPAEAPAPTAETPPPTTTRPADPAQPVQPSAAATAKPIPAEKIVDKPAAPIAVAPSPDKPAAAVQQRVIEPVSGFQAAPEIVVTGNDADPIAKQAAKPAEPLPLPQAGKPEQPAELPTPQPATPVAPETVSRLQALRNALLPIGDGASRAERRPGAAPMPAPRVTFESIAPAPLASPPAVEAAASPSQAEIRPGSSDAVQPTSPTQAAQAPAPVAAQRPVEQPVAEKIDRSIERALDLAQDSEWLDRVSREIASLGDRDGTLRFRLNPQSLGQLRVELSQTDQGMTVRLAVETEAARTLLADAQPRLIAEARAQGVRIAEASVHLAGSDQQQQSADPRRQEDARAGAAMIRTPSGQTDQTQAQGRSGRSRSDRYA